MRQSKNSTGTFSCKDVFSSFVRWAPIANESRNTPLLENEKVGGAVELFHADSLMSSYDILWNNPEGKHIPDPLLIYGTRLLPFLKTHFAKFTYPMPPYSFISISLFIFPWVTKAPKLSKWNFFWMDRLINFKFTVCLAYNLSRATINFFNRNALSRNNDSCL